MKPDANDIDNQVQDRNPGVEFKMDPSPEVIRDGYRGSGKLENKVAIITGGDSGIGRSVAVHFAREGADVAIVYLNEDRDARTTKELVEREGRRCLTFAGDQGDSSFCNYVVKETIAEFGQLDCLVNNAGFQDQIEDFTKISDEHWRKTFRTNVDGYFFFARAAMPHLKKGSTIINTSSVNAFMGMGSMLDYSSTKGANLAFSRSLADSLTPKGIRVNTVAPGPIWTPFIPGGMNNTKDFGANTPMGRPGQPSELGPAYVFLASEDSSYIAGQTIHINGGMVTGG
ncbi:SDR family oxidoreductase [Neolewinella agarilytica]|uniref:NAD(P)-dependent dehydrogenase, short-chain alcohol dehydrogenase family n=1 Tax=Neolewinella agarilytica TaxID=478744 RepID=A0A1H9III5_9BACT|nr:SDR family oxidoreductase [Neolewinella agarilytica]SEQ74404.1 NAD(P)-dependent dehydrogenase, short-chain alcohol dehydrogenase family [Neolewinella agarilytica]